MRIEVAALLILPGLCSPAQALLFCGGPISSAVTVSATDLSFGTYAPSSPSHASAGISVRCSALGIDLLPSFTVSLIAASSADPSARTLNSGARRLNYNIYTTSGYSAVWGDGSSGSATQSYSSLLVLGSVAFTAWGRLPQGQYVPAGTYSDRITVLVSY